MNEVSKQSVPIKMMLAFAVLVGGLFLGGFTVDAAATNPNNGAVNEKDWTYTKGTNDVATLNSDGGITITGYTGKESTVKIPKTLTVKVQTGTDDKGNPITADAVKKVTQLADNLFYDADVIEDVTISSNITTIGNYTFYSCRNLKSVTIPSSVTTIGNGAFEYCTALESVAIPSGVTTIGEAAFEYCTSLESATVSSTVTTINKHAFFGCAALTDLQLMLPSTITTIGASAFSGCSALPSVTIPSSVTAISDDAFENCSKLSGVTILSGGSNVTVGKGAFEGCTSLVMLELPKKVTSIGHHAFWNCTSLLGVIMPDNLAAASIDNDAFEGCPADLTLYGSASSTGVRQYAAAQNIYFKYKTGALSRMTLEKTTANYTGNVIKPAVTEVRDAAGNVVGSANYTVTYKNNKKIGTATVTVTANSDSYYSGSLSATFTIRIRKTAFTTLERGVGALGLRWKARPEAGGYQVQYSRYSDFRKSSGSTKTKTISGSENTTVFLTSLAQNTKYYVRVRGVKTVGGVKYYGNWSDVWIAKTH